MTNKFARRFVMAGSVKIRILRRHLKREGAAAAGFRQARDKRLTTRRFTMRTTILTILGPAMLALSTVQIAAATEHHRVHRTPVPLADQYRNSNAYYAAPAPWGQPGWSSRYGDWSQYKNAAESAPAGR